MNEADRADVYAAQETFDEVITHSSILEENLNNWLGDLEDLFHTDQHEGAEMLAEATRLNKYEAMHLLCRLYRLEHPGPDPETESSDQPGCANCKDDKGLLAKWCQHCRDAALSSVEEVRALRQWVNDLQSGMYINCVYCGHQYGPQDEVPATMAKVLEDHISQCPKHPLATALKKLKKQEQGIRGVVHLLRNGPNPGYVGKAIAQLEDLLPSPTERRFDV